VIQKIAETFLIPKKDLTVSKKVILASFMISASQIRAARALLGWSGIILAEKSGVSLKTLRRYELQEGVPSAHVNSLKLIEDALLSAGIEFTGDPLVNPGVTLNIKR